MDSPKRHIADEHVDESSPPNHVVTPDEHSDKGAIISRGQHGHSVEFTYYSSNLPSPDFEEHDEAISSLLKEIKSQDKIIKNLQGQIHSPRVITEPKVIHGRFDSPQKEAIAVTAHIMDLQEKLHFLARQVFESNQRIAGLEKDLRKKKQESAIIAEEDFMNYNSDRIHLHNAVSTLKGELRERDVQVAEIQKTIIENCSHPTTNTNGKSFDPSTSSNH
jgi:chromosome segregation ATPase